MKNNLPQHLGFGGLMILAFSFSKAGAQTYCTPGFYGCNLNGEYIKNFSTTGGSSNISNLNSGCVSTNGYSYLNQTLTAQQGSVVDYNILVNYHSFMCNMSIYIDCNHDFDFDDPGELVKFRAFNNMSGANSGSGLSDTFKIPVFALPGPTRIRVLYWMITGIPPYPCEGGYGEGEDYNIDIQAVTTPCTGTPNVNAALAGVSQTCYGNLFTLAPQNITMGSGITVQWQQSGNAGSTWTDIPGGTTPMYTTWAADTTSYRARVGCSNSGLSVYSTPVEVTTLPVIDCQDSVWPGDANFDYVVDNVDPLYIAVALGSTGDPRPFASLTWIGQEAFQWGHAFANGIDHYHADCNGDGIVDTSDLQAVYQNFSQTHLKGSPQPHAKTSGLPDLYFDMSGLNTTPGSTVVAPLKFGSTANPANNIYGVAGTVTINGVSPAAQPVMSFDAGWLGNGSNTLQFKKATSNNTVAWTYAKIDQTDASGSGILGYLTFTIPATATGQVTLDLSNVTVINSTGDPLTDYNVVNDTSVVTGIASNHIPVRDMAIVPNPSGSRAELRFTVLTAGTVTLKLTDVTGRPVWQDEVKVQPGIGIVSLPAADVPAGMYLLQVNGNQQRTPSTLKWIKR